MKPVRPAIPLEPDTAALAVRLASCHPLIWLVGAALPVGLLLGLDATPSGALPGFPDVPLPPAGRVALFVLTALTACLTLDAVFDRALGMRRGLQALAIVLGCLGVGVALEALAYLQPRAPDSLEQRYHFAMQHLMAALLTALAYTALRRLLQREQHSAVAAVLAARARASTNAVDAFAGLNLALFLAMTVFFYRDRFIHYRGLAHIAEFYFYALLIFAAICALWRTFRHAAIPVVVLTALQLGIVMHFAGGLVFQDGGRLYDIHIAGIRFDKYVHLVNGCAAGLLVSWVWRRGEVRDCGLALGSVVLAVLGLGGVVEIAEYLVYCTVPRNGVGGYDNNMQDLFANLLGAVCAVLLHRRLTSRERR